MSAAVTVEGGSLRTSPAVIFLPGASGAGQFWKPVADCLPETWHSRLVDYPGFGLQPADSRVRTFDDLADLVLSDIHEPVDLVAQSMGGVVAVKIALARPDAVRRLVLVATSGGIDLSGFDVEDWRAEYRAEYPRALPFVTDDRQPDLSDRLATIEAPTLLVWATGDRISPPDVGRTLQSRLTAAPSRLVILDHTDHMFARDHADEVGPLIREFLSEA